MRKLLLLAVIATLVSCQKEDIVIESHNYEFEMVGRTFQDTEGYYHVAINPTEGQQTLHRFGAYVTNVDKWDLPTQITWRCDAFWYTPDTLGHTYIEVGQVPTGESPWSWENFAVTGYGGMTVPIVNGTSNADPVTDSVYCMMAPIGAMVGDTVTIYGMALFEEGMIEKFDNIKVIFE